MSSDSTRSPKLNAILRVFQCVDFKMGLYVHCRSDDGIGTDITDILDTAHRATCHRPTAVVEGDSTQITQSPVICAESGSDDLERYSTDLNRTYLLHEEDESSGSAAVPLYEELEAERAEHQEFMSELLQCKVDLSMFTTEQQCFPSYRETIAE